MFDVNLTIPLINIWQITINIKSSAIILILSKQQNYDSKTVCNFFFNISWNSVYNESKIVSLTLHFVFCNLKMASSWHYLNKTLFK